MNKEISTTMKPIGKTKIILLQLPVESWEKFNALHSVAAAKVPGLTHDMIVSAWVVEMLQRAPEPIINEQPEIATNAS